MKHNFKVTLFLVIIFVLSQLIGLIIINQYIDIEKTSETGKTHIREGAFNKTGFEPPQLEPEQERMMWLYVTFAILIGTVLILLIIRFRKNKIWVLWFLLSIGVCLYIALAQFIPIFLDFLGIKSDMELFPFSFFGFPITISWIITLILVGLLAYFKVFKKNVVVHNFTEIFIYGGLAALIVPNIALSAAIILLIVISLYDMVAVWKTKHMISLANFQTENKLFAGLMMPYDEKSNKLSLIDKHKKIDGSKNNKSPKRIKTAILGGGDIAFPLIFAGTVMKTFASFIYPIIIIITTAIALFILLTYSKKDKFYPAMPFISGGALFGYLLVILI